MINDTAIWPYVWPAGDVQHHSSLMLWDDANGVREVRNSTNVVLKIYDLLGNEVKNLLQAIVQTGVQQIEWDGTDNRGVQVGAGIYIYKLQANGQSKSRKILLLR